MNKQNKSKVINTLTKLILFRKNILLKFLALEENFANKIFQYSFFKEFMLVELI